MAMKTCPSCGGSGVKNTSISKGASSNICSGCGGSGQVVDHSGGGGGGGQAGCFPSGTMVRTPEGETPVEKLRPTDQVVTQNRSGDFVTREIIRKNLYTAKSVSSIYFEDGTFLRVTDHHTVRSRRGWIRVRDLTEGCEIAKACTHGGRRWIGIDRIEREVSVESVYNIVVAGECTFVAEGVIAHSFTYFRRTRTALQRLRYSITSFDHAGTRARQSQTGLEPLFF